MWLSVTNQAGATMSIESFESHLLDSLNKGGVITHKSLDQEFSVETLHALQWQLIHRLEV